MTTQTAAPATQLQQIEQTMEEPVYCQPDKPGIVDMAVRRDDGVFVGMFSRKTLQELDAEYPGVVMSSMKDVVDRQQAMMKRAPKEITQDDFNDALYCLPPMGWVSRGNTESFKMCEFTCGAITGIYVRDGERFFALSDVFTLSHENIIFAVRAAFPVH